LYDWKNPVTSGERDRPGLPLFFDDDTSDDFWEKDFFESFFQSKKAKSTSPSLYDFEPSEDYSSTRTIY
jgi:hypothetical protein